MPKALSTSLISWIWRKESHFSISWAVISRVIVMSFSSRTFWNTDFNLPVISSFFIWRFTFANYELILPHHDLGVVGKQSAEFSIFRTFFALKSKTHFLVSCYGWDVISHQLDLGKESKPAMKQRAKGYE